MRHSLFVAIVATALAAPVASAQTGSAAPAQNPFKLGTFEIAGEGKIGIVLQDRHIVDKLKERLERIERRLELTN